MAYLHNPRCKCFVHSFEIQDFMGRLLFTLAFLLLSSWAFSQCQIYDGQGNVSANPTFVSCTGGAYTVFVQSPNNLGSITIDWGDGTPNSAAASLIPPSFISHTYAATIANYTLTLTDATNGCSLTGLVVMEKPVNASIQIPIGGVTQTCAPSDLIFNNSSTDVSSNTNFTWNFGDGSPILNFGDTNAGQTITHTYEKNTVTCVTQVTLTAENYCSFGNPTMASFNPIQIYDVDVAAISANYTLLCYPDTVVHFANITAKNCVPQGNTAQRFEYWNFGNYWGTGSDSIVNWVPFDPPAKPGYDIAFPGIGTYTIMMADSNLCGADTTFITIDIVPAPTAGITANTDSACTGDVITFTNTSFGGANQYLVNYGSGGGFVGAGTGNFTHSYATAGNYTVRLVANIVGGTNSCTDTAEVDVVVLPSPNVNISLGNASDCDSTTVSFINTSTGGSIYAWNFGNGNTSTAQNPADEDYTTPGQFTVSLVVTSNNGCTDNSSALVRVYDTPIADFIPQNVCEDAVATFLDASSVGYGGPVNFWSWNFGDALSTTSSVPNPTFTYVDSGSFVVSLIASTAFCADTAYDTILVEPRPTASFAMSTDLGCSPLSVAFTNNTINASTYEWSFGDGNTSTQAAPNCVFNHSGQTDTTFVVKLVAVSAFGCRDSIVDTVTVLGNPNASFTSNATLDCAPLQVAFTNTTTGAISYQWNFGDSTGSSVMNPGHVFQNQTPFITNYSVDLVATGNNGCTDTSTQAITIYPEPLFNFSIIPDSGCSPLLVQFPVAVGAVLYNWDFGDGSTSSGPNPTHTFVNTTTNNANYNVQLIATSPFGCIDTVTGSAIVFPNPTANLSPSVSQGCQPLQVTFVNGSTGGTGYAWNFGDGGTSTTTNASINHTFINSTNDTLDFQPSLIVTTDDGCADTATVDVHVFRPVNASFSANTVGCHPLPVSFTNASANAAINSWTFGDGASSALVNPTHIYQNSGTAPVNSTATLTVQTLEGCQNDTSISITVNHKPTAQILPISAAGCEPLSVNFTNSSIAGTSFLWDFDDGSTATTTNVAAHSYPNNTNDTLFFNPTLYVGTAQGCFDTAFANVQVYRKVNASYSVPQVGCSPFVAQFTDQSLNANSYNWSFGDGNSSILSNPSHLYVNNGAAPQNLNVNLTVQSVEGCQSDTTVPVTINHKPNAQISPATFTGCQPLLVNMANNSAGANDYLWVFGDGDSTNISGSVSHTFSNATNNTVIFNPYLIASTTQGCYDTAYAAVNVYRKVEASFVTPTVGCHPFSTNIASNSLNAVSWLWNFGDGFTSTGVNTVHQYQNTTAAAVNFNLTLTVQSVDGCVDDTTVVMTTNPTPTSFFNIANTPACHGEDVTITNLSQQNMINYWQFGANGFPGLNNFSQLDTIFFNFSPNPRVFPIKLMVENSFGCKDTSQKTMTVYPAVNAEIVALNEGCGPFEVDFNNLSTGGQLYTWDFDDGTNSFLDEPTHTFVNTSSNDVIYNVVLQVTSPFGCVSTDTLSIVVHPLPNPAFTVSPNTQTFPNTTFLIDNVTVGTWDYHWNFGDGVQFNIAEPINHQYATWGTYKIVLTASGEFCEDTTSRTVTVYPPVPVADFEIDTQACAPVVVQFQSLSEYAESFFWQFGDGTSSSSENPSHTYQFAGDFTVSLLVVGPGGDSSYKELPNAIRVLFSPTANFVFTPNEVTIPNQPVSFINYSQFASEYLWNFGDSITSTDENPQHNYLSTGQFFPWLVAIAEGGCTDTLFNQLPVTAIEKGIIEIPNAFTPNTQSGSGGSYDPYATNNQVFFPILTGVTSEDFTLSIFNRWGELLFETHEINMGWDGYYRERLCQQDVYVWKIQGKYITGESFTQVGDVTLIR
jgi:gliding motility-associated-like protein